MLRAVPSPLVLERSSPRRSRRYGDNAQRMATLLAPITGAGRVVFFPRIPSIMNLCVSAFACYPYRLLPSVVCMSAPPLACLVCFPLSAAC